MNIIVGEHDVTSVVTSGSENRHSPSHARSLSTLSAGTFFLDYDQDSPPPSPSTLASSAPSSPVWETKRGISLKVARSGVVFNNPSGVRSESCPISTFNRRRSLSPRIQDIMVDWEDIPILPSARPSEPQSGDVLIAGCASPSGWVRVCDGVIPPSKIQDLTTAELASAASDLGLVVWRESFLAMDPNTTLIDARRLIRRLRDRVGDLFEVVEVVREDGSRGVLEIAEIMAPGAKF
jgi:hypothetical protein